MSSFVDSSNNVINIEFSKVTRTVSDSVGETSSSNHSVSDGPSYEWVNPHALKIPISFRDSDVLDKFLSKVSFIKLDAPLTR